MTIIELNRREAGPEKTGLAQWCRKLLAEAKARRRQRRMQLELSELDERLLRDIGIEPLDVWEAGRGRASPVLFYPIRKPQPPR